MGEGKMQADSNRDMNAMARTGANLIPIVKTPFCLYSTPEC